MKLFTPSSTDLRNMVKAAEAKADRARYTNRAQAAHAAAEAASDPRDKAAFRAAAQTWERLAKPVEHTYSLAPQRLQVEALKRDAAEAVQTDWRREAATRGAQKALERVASAFAQPVTIEF